MQLFKRKPLPESEWLAEKRILVHFKTQTQSLDGYLVRETDNNYFLSRSKLLDENSREFDMEGLILVPKVDIFFIQVLAENWAL